MSRIIAGIGVPHEIQITLLDRLSNHMLGLQTLVWSGETITGVALFSRTFPLWQTADQVVGIAALIGIGWLTYRVGD